MTLGCAYYNTVFMARAEVESNLSSFLPQLATTIHEFLTLGRQWLLLVVQRSKQTRHL